MAQARARPVASATPALPRCIVAALFFCAGRRTTEANEGAEGTEARCSVASVHFSVSVIPDPAHTMLAVSDAQGNGQGHLWYDPHGSVLSSTLPVTLTEHIFSAQGLDSRLGLVYHGAGRWYDPATAHSLQPDPFGGVPQLPQTLNRYAVPRGVVSPPGLGRQTGYTASFPWAALEKSTLSESVSALIAEKALGPAAERLISRAPWYWLHVTGSGYQSSRALLKRLLRERGGPPSISRRLATGTLDEWSGVVRVGDDYWDLVNRLGRRGVSVEARPIARSVWGFGPKYLTIGDIVPGLGADLLVGGLWQLGEDVITHPELLNDPELLARRVGAGAMYNATTGLMGTGIAGGIALGLTAAGVTVAAPVVVVGGIAVTIIIEVGWGEQIEDWWFERLNAHAPWE
jgi:hypothetical protein